jgi:hypothetical protein
MKVMKYIALGLSLFIAMFLLCWLAGGFITLDYDSSNWQQGSRFVLICFPSLISLYVTGVLAAHRVFK